MRKQRRHQRVNAEDGVTIVEIAVALAIFGLALALAYPALFSGTGLLGLVDDESRGLADVRTVGERMSRDLRAARGIMGTSTVSELHVWIDYDANYAADAGETITWRIEPSGIAGQFNVVRADNAGRSQVVANTLVSSIAFSYSPPLPSPPASPPRMEPVRVVSVAMRYDAIPGQHSSEKVSQFDMRLRNVE